MNKNFYSVLLIIIFLVLICITCVSCNKSNTTAEVKSADKFYSQWMSYLKDDVKLSEIVIPGSHDAGTNGMANYAETQNDRMDVQMQFGARYFDVRVSKKKDKLYFFHALNNKKYEFKNFCTQTMGFLDEYPSEFIILDFQHFKGKSMSDVESTIEKYLKPDEYAVKSTENISDLTMGTIREKGYRYIIIWEDLFSEATKDYQFIRKNILNSPYSSDINNQKPEEFINDYIKYYNKTPSDKPIFVLQAQHTCNYIKLQFNISKREKELRPLANKYFTDLYENEELLNKTNVIMRDFITDDIETINIMLRLNIVKGNFESIPEILDTN